MGFVFFTVDFKQVISYTILKLSRTINYTCLPICNQDKLICKLDWRYFE